MMLIIPLQLFQVYVGPCSRVVKYTKLLKNLEKVAVFIHYFL